MVRWLIALFSISVVVGNHAQSLCRNKRTGIVRWFSSNACPSDYASIRRSIKSSNLKSNSVKSDVLDDHSVKNRHIAPDANIDGSKIAVNSIPLNRIQGGSLSIIDSAAIQNGTIMDVDISPNAGIAFSKINALGQITDSHISSSANIKWSKISTADSKIRGDQIEINTLDSVHLKDRSVTHAKLADDSVVGGIGGVIKDGSITDHDISPTAGIAWSKIYAENQITNSHISTNANIDWSKISTAVNKIQGSTQIADGTITGSKLQDNTITGNKLVDGSISSEKLAPNSINPASHIPSGSINWDRVNQNSVSVSSNQLNIDITSNPPYTVWVGRTTSTLPNSGTQFLYPVGASAPSASHASVDMRNPHCKQFYVYVELATAPGLGNSRQFSLFNGSTQIGSGSCTISNNTPPFSCSFVTSEPTPPNSVSLRAMVTAGSPAASQLYWTIVCK